MAHALAHESYVLVLRTANRLVAVRISHMSLWLFLLITATANVKSDLTASNSGGGWLLLQEIGDGRAWGN